MTFDLCCNFFLARPTSERPQNIDGQIVDMVRAIGSGRLVLYEDQLPSIEQRLFVEQQRLDLLRSIRANIIRDEELR